MKRAAAILLIALLHAGCAGTSSIIVTGAQPSTHIRKTKGASLFWGLIPVAGSIWDARADCPGGVAKIDVSGGGHFIGIYDSYSVDIWCAAPTGQAMGGAGTQNPGAGNVIIVR